MWCISVLSCPDDVVHFCIENEILKIEIHGGVFSTTKYPPKMAAARKLRRA